MCLSSVSAPGGQHVLASGEVVMGVLFSSVAVLMVVRLWVLGGAGGDGSGVP